MLGVYIEVLKSFRRASKALLDDHISGPCEVWRKQPDQAYTLKRP